MKRMRINFIGDRSMLDDDLRQKMSEVEQISKNTKELIVNFAINYGGRQEIVNACNLAIELSKKGEIVTATYILQNASTDLSTDLSVSTTNSNTEYFTLSSELAKTSLKAGETTITVTSANDWKYTSKALTKYDENIFSDKGYLELSEKYMKTALLSDSFFEVNTGAMSRGYRTTPYPNPFLLQEMAKAADALVEQNNVQIVLLPLQYPADVTACRKLQQFMKEDAVILDAAFDTEQFLALMGNFSLLIGMRLHALIFAAVMEVPFIALSYDPKIDGFVKEVNGTNIGAIENFVAEDLVVAAQNVLKLENTSNERLVQLREKALENSQLAFGLLNR